VQEIKEEAAVQSPPIATISTPPPPPPLQQQPASPLPTIATAVAAVQDESLKSPGHSRPSVHAAIALPPVPVEPLQPEPVDTKESEVPPSVTTPPPPPRSSRPVSVIVPSTSSTQLAHPASPRATSPISPRQGSASTFSTFEAPTSPTHSIPGRLSRSSTMSRHERPIPEIPLETEETRQQDAITTTTTAPAAVEAPHSEGQAASVTSSYILPAPVARSRPTPPLARPPSIHQANENRKSVALPPVPSEPEEPVVHPVIEEEEEEEAVEEKEEEAPQPVAETHQEPEVVGQQAHEATLPSPPETTAPTEVPSQEQPIAKEAAAVSPPVYQEADVEAETQDKAEEEEAGGKTADVQEQSQEVLQEVPAAVTAPDTSSGGEEVAPTVEEKEPDVEPEKAKLPELESSGPVLNHASRPRPAKGRKLPSAPAATPETSFASQLEADVKVLFYHSPKFFFLAV